MSVGGCVPDGCFWSSSGWDGWACWPEPSWLLSRPLAASPSLRWTGGTRDPFTKSLMLTPFHMDLKVWFHCHICWHAHFVTMSSSFLRRKHSNLVFARQPGWCGNTVLSRVKVPWQHFLRFQRLSADQTACWLGSLCVTHGPKIRKSLSDVLSFRHSLNWISNICYSVAENPFFKGYLDMIPFLPCYLSSFRGQEELIDKNHKH